MTCHCEHHELSHRYRDGDRADCLARGCGCDGYETNGKAA